MKKKKNGFWGLIRGLLLPAAAVAALLWFATAVDGLNTGRAVAASSVERRVGNEC